MEKLGDLIDLVVDGLGDRPAGTPHVMSVPTEQSSGGRAITPPTRDQVFEMSTFGFIIESRSASRACMAAMT